MSFKPTKDKLLIYFKAPNITVLGPGCRFAVWVQGCNRHCIGCIAKDAQSFDGGTSVRVSDLAAEIIESHSEGLTVSGGEPFLQSEALVGLIEHVRKFIDAGVIVYTGFTYDFLHSKGTESQRKLLSYIDVLIDGEYRIELDDAKPHRGSSNQQILFLTNRYSGKKDKYYNGIGVRRTQTIPETCTVSFKAGIPDVVPRDDGLLDERTINKILRSHRIKI